MNKNFKIFQVHGLSGLLVFGFIMAGVFCGFVLFPVWVLMTGWNELVGNVFNGPVINYYQASLLWVFIALCFYLVLRNSISIKIHKTDHFDPEEINKVIDTIDIEEKIEETINDK